MLTETGRPRVIVADDHAQLRRAMSRMLSPDCDVVAEASDGASVIDMLSDLHPDAVVMDIQMPVMNGLVACAIIHRDFPEIPVVIVTGLPEEDLLDVARDAGAVSFVCKHRLSLDLRAAIRVALDTVGRVPSGTH